MDPQKTAPGFLGTVSNKTQASCRYLSAFFKTCKIVVLKSPFVHAGRYHPQLGFQHKTITYLQNVVFFLLIIIIIIFSPGAAITKTP